MAQQFYNMPIDLSVDWGGDENTGGLRVKGNRVQELIKSHLSSPYYKVYDDKKRVHRFFVEKADADLAELTLAAGDELPQELLVKESFYLEAPAPYKVSVRCTQDNNNILDGSVGNYLQFTWQTVNSSGVPENERVNVTITFTNLGTSVQYRTTYAIGEEGNLLIDSYLKPGKNEITIIVTGQTTSATGMTSVVWNVVSLGISSLFNVALSQTPNKQGLVDLPVSYKAWGGYDKYVEFFIDGSSVGNQYFPANHNPNEVQANYDLNVLSRRLDPGKHTLLLRVRVEFNELKFYSKVIGYEFIVTGLYQLDVTIAFEIKSGIPVSQNSDLIIYGELFKNMTIDWGYFTSNIAEPTATVEWKMKDKNGNYTSLGTRNATTLDATNNTTPEPLKFAPVQDGEFTIEAVVGTTVLSSYKLVVAKNTQGIEKATGVEFELTALGRSDDEPERMFNSWAYKEYKATFHGTHSWKNDALILEGAGNYLTFNFAPLSNNPTDNGFTMEVQFETFNIDDEDTPVLKIGELNQGSVRIYGKRAELRSAGGALVKTQYNNDDRQTIAFIINPNQASGKTNEPNLMYIQSDGVRERVNNYQNSDSFSSNEVLTIGDPSGRVGIKLYSIVIYHNALSRDAVFQNFLINSGDKLTSILEFNDILDATTGEISLDKISGKVDVIKLTGDVKLTFNNTGEVKIPVDFIREAVDPWCNLTITGMRFTNPGQSTRGFPITQQRGYTDKDNCVAIDYNGQRLYKGYYAIENGGIPEKKFRMNPQYVDSSMGLAATFFRMVNKTHPRTIMDGKYILRTEAQNYALEDYPKVMGQDFPYTILNVPNPVPAVEFWREKDSDDYKYLSQFTIAHEKKSARAFGQRSIYKAKTTSGTLDPFCLYTEKNNFKPALWDNSNCILFEILQNADALLATFKDTSSWDEYIYDSNGVAISKKWEQVFEMEYPDADDVTESEKAGIESIFKRFCDWVASCYQVDQGRDGSKLKFQQEAANHMLLPKWAAYRILLLKNMMVDNSVRNMEICTDDGTHWWPKWWDADVQFGIRNDGPLVFSPGIDRQSKDPDDPNAYAFAGHDSWLWDAFESWDWFMDELTPKVNHALVQAGWTRKNFIDEFETFTSRYPERLYNESGHSKYIVPYFEGNNYLAYSKGRMKAYIRYMVAECYTKWDAEWCSGEYASSFFYIRAGGAPRGTVMKFKAAKNFTFGWALTDTSRILDKNVKKNRGETFTFTVKVDALGVNDPAIIYGPNALEEVDLSGIARYMSAAVQLHHHYDEDMGTNLKVLNVGVPKALMKTTGSVPIRWDGDGNVLESQQLPVRNYQTSLSFTGINTMSRLEELNIQGLAGIIAFNDTDKLISLKKFYAAGSGITSFKAADNRTFDVLEFPDKLISIEGTGMDWSSLKFFDDNINELTSIPTSLKKLYFRNGSTATSIRDLIIRLADNIHNASDDEKLLYDLLLTNVYWEEVPVEALLKLAEIPIANRRITGVIVLNNRLTTEMMSRLMNLYGDTIFDAAAPLKISAPSSFVVGISGDVWQDASGKWCMYAGGSAQLTAVAFPIDYGTNYLWTIMGGSTTGNTCSYKTLDLNTVTAKVTTLESNIDDFEVTFSASDGTRGDTLTLKVLKCTYPTKVHIYPIDEDQNKLQLINNEFLIVEGGYYYFKAIFTLDGLELPEYNKGGWGKYGSIKHPNGWKWSYSDNSGYTVECEILEHHEELGTNEFLFCLHVLDTPRDDLRIPLGYYADLYNNSKVTADTLGILLYSIFRVIGTRPNIYGGNVGLYNKLLANGWEDDDATWMTNKALKNHSAGLEFEESDEVLDFSCTSLDKTGATMVHPNVLKYVNYLQYLKAPYTLLNGVTDITNNKYITEVDLQGTLSSIKI